MKKIICAVAVAASFAAPQAFAQAKNFEGFSLTGNLNFANSTTEVTSTTVNAKSTESATNLGLQAQYNWALGSSFVLGLGASLGVGDTKAGTFSGGATTAKLKSTASVYLAPGFAASDSLLIYGKVASLGGTLEVTGNGTTVTQTLNGVGYGLGFQTAIDKNLFVQVEYMQNNYADRTFVLNNEVDKSNASVLSVGIGYKF